MQCFLSFFAARLRRVLGLSTAFLLVTGWPCLVLAESHEAAPKLPFAETIERYHAEDAEAMPPKGAVLGVGSSSMRIWGSRMQADLAPLTVIPRGFGGSQFFQLNLAFEELVARYQPRAIMVYEGDNDLAGGKSIEETLRDFLIFLNKVRELDPAIRVYVFGVKPSTARTQIWPIAKDFNECVKAICDRVDGVEYVDVATPLLNPDGSINDSLFRSDRIHLNDAGYDLWTKAVRSVLIPAELPHEEQVPPARD